MDSIPVLCDLAQLLAERGHRVDIFTDEWPGFGLPEFSHSAIRVVVIMKSRRHSMARVAQPDSAVGAQPPSRRRLWSQAPRQRAVDLARWLAASRAWRAARRFGGDARLLLEAARAWWRSGRDPYLCVIGVDPEGLRRASVLTRFTRSTIAYYSLELMLSDEITSREERALKAHERELSRRARFVIIQDEERARLLATDNSIPIERFVFVPNAPPGPARRSPSRWWHEQFGLAPGTRVVLHSGSIGPWTGIDGIVRAAQGLPDGWVLVVHTRFDPAAADPEQAQRLAELRRQAPLDKVFFSVRPVPRRELAPLVDGADVGVAFYVPLEDGDTYTRENIRSIGLSSGKVASYLAAGLPIIVNSASSLGELAEREGFGISVRAADELGHAIGRISADYEFYALRARTFFDQRLDFRQGFERILSRLQAAPSAGGS
jgi:glycosyltransferase involved in cell wall biosynthesis